MPHWPGSMRPAAVMAFGVFVLGLFLAQVANQGVFRVGPLPVPGNCVEWAGINSIKDHGSPCGGGGGVACTAGAVDLSLTTGCNIPFYLGGIFP